MNNTIKEIVEWFKHFDGEDVKIIGETIEMNMNIQLLQLPHLLGLHYMNPKTYSNNAKFILNKINKYTDEEIYSRINTYHGNRILQNVKNRVNTFKDFMENITDAKIVEMTHHNTKLKSKYLIINTDDGFTRHLALLESQVDQIYKIYFPETYLFQRNSNYYKESKILENVEKLLFYDEKNDLWRGGSFDYDKEQLLKKCTLNKVSYSPSEYKKIKSRIIYKKFNFIPLRGFNVFEKELSLQEISSYLEYDGMSTIGDDFYDITQDENDLYFNIETGNIYIPCHNGFQKYNIDVEKELISFFKTYQIQQEEDCQTHLELYSFEPLQQEKDESEIDL